MIETFSLSASRDGGKTSAVSSLCLRVESGESCALLGANGAGKSTLMLSLVGLAPILSGRAEVCGLEVAKKNLRRIRALAGLVFQNSDDQLFCQTILEDVAFGVENLGFSRGESLETAREWLEKFSISNLADRSPHGLSEGEKGEVLSLYPLLPNKMSVERDNNGVLYYVYSRYSDENPNMKKIREANKYL